MLRRLFQLFALVALVLGGSAEAMRAPVEAVHLVCACGCPETPAPECPCGMPRTPTPPRAPVTSSAQAVLVAASVSATESAQSQPRGRNPWFAAWLAAVPEQIGFQARAGSGSAPAAPPGRSLDRLAQWAVFRI